MTTSGNVVIAESMLRQTVYLALVSPEPVINRLALYESSETKGRHTEAGMSILRYALAGYITGVVTDKDIVSPIVEPYDETVDITYMSDIDERVVTVEYPGWLKDFFDSEDRFAYLQPGHAGTLADVLVEMGEHAAEYDVPSTQEGASEDDGEAQEAEDSGKESAYLDDPTEEEESGSDPVEANDETDLARM